MGLESYYFGESQGDLGISFSAQKDKYASVSFIALGPNAPTYEKFCEDLDIYVKTDYDSDLEAEDKFIEGKKRTTFNIGDAQVDVQESMLGYKKGVLVVVYSSSDNNKTLDEYFDECFTNTDKIVHLMGKYIDVSFFEEEISKFSVEKLEKKIQVNLFDLVMEYFIGPIFNKGKDYYKSVEGQTKYQNSDIKKEEIPDSVQEFLDKTDPKNR